MEDKNTFRVQESVPYVKFEPIVACVSFWLSFHHLATIWKNSSGTHAKDFDDFLFSEIAAFRQWVPVGCQNIAVFLTCFIFFSGL
jgi:hypothetical protein